jgi:hypothetical protein
MVTTSISPGVRLRLWRQGERGPASEGTSTVASNTVVHILGRERHGRNCRDPELIAKGETCHYNWL